MKRVRFARRSILLSVIMVMMAAATSFAGGGWGYDGQDGLTLPGSWGHV